LAPGANPFRSLCAPEWFARAEAIALSGLADGFDLDGFDAQVLALGAPTWGTEHQWAEQADAGDRLGSLEGWRLEVQSPAHLMDACPNLLAHALGELFFAYSLWWTSGSERVAPSLLACQGLPAPESFAALLGGGWSGAGWQRLGPGG
jgi:type VI secretion system protein ImpM